MNFHTTKRKMRLIATSALVAVSLSGCSTVGSVLGINDDQVDTSSLASMNDLDNKGVTQAVLQAEAAVLAVPRDASMRTMLGNAYLKSGRFQSAASAFGDAIALGESNPRTALSYALAEAAIGNQATALATLRDWRESIAPADLGLALALAGEPDRGVAVLSNALRSGESDAKTRQNLAYAYALQGNWRGARLMAEEDLPANQVNDRIAEWAASARPEAYQERIAKLLGVSVVEDSGLPAMLALSNFSDTEQSSAVDSASETEGELPALSTNTQIEPASKTPQPVPTGVSAEAAVVTQGSSQFEGSFSSIEAEKPASQSNLVYVDASTAQAASRPAAPQPAAAQPVMSAAKATHLIQLGSFNNRAVAEESSRKLQRLHAQLAGRDMIITKAQVKGKTFWRVAATGFDEAAARSTCNALKAKKQGCFPYSASQRLPGAVDQGMRIAAR